MFLFGCTRVWYRWPCRCAWMGRISDGRFFVVGFFPSFVPSTRHTSSHPFVDVFLFESWTCLVSISPSHTNTSTSHGVRPFPLLTWMVSCHFHLLFRRDVVQRMSMNDTMVSICVQDQHGSKGNWSMGKGSPHPIHQLLLPPIQGRSVRNSRQPWMGTSEEKEKDQVPTIDPKRKKTRIHHLKTTGTDRTALTWPVVLAIKEARPYAYVGRLALRADPMAM